MKSFRIALLFCLSLVFVFSVSGCTLKFKATEVDFDGGMTGNLVLDGVEVFDIPLCQNHSTDRFKPDDFSVKFYARNLEKNR